MVHIASFAVPYGHVVVCFHQILFGLDVPKKSVVPNIRNTHKYRTLYCTLYRQKYQTSSKLHVKNNNYVLVRYLHFVILKNGIAFLPSFHKPLALPPSSVPGTVTQGHIKKK